MTDTPRVADHPLRVGLIGLGNVGLGYHLPALLDLPDLYRVVAIADPTPERRETGREQAGLGEAEVYADPLALLARDDVDLVDLCTPQHVRRELAIETLRSGRHLLTEKPIATTPADARAIIAAAREAGVRFGIMHNYLFFPEVLRTIELIGEGQIGPAEVAILNWLGCADNPGTASYQPRWRHDPRLAGGGVLMDMLHIVYLAEALLGRPIERVSGWLHARESDAHVEAIALARLEVEDGAAQVNVGWGDGPGGFSVSGAQGRIEVYYEDGGSGAFVPFERLEIHGVGGHRVERDMRSDLGIRGTLRDFAASVATGRDPAASGEQGLHILEATLAVYLSAATGGTIELPLPDEHPVSRLGVAGLAEVELAPWSPVRGRGLFGVRS
ncbi:MAG: Gfo/Idh/MocA family protein [Chloroflexota bacterium]